MTDCRYIESRSRGAAQMGGGIEFCIVKTHFIHNRLLAPAVKPRIDPLIPQDDSALQEAHEIHLTWFGVMPTELTIDVDPGRLMAYKGFIRGSGR